MRKPDGDDPMMEMAGSEGKKNPGWIRGWYPASIVFGFSLLALGAVFWSTYREIVAIWWRSETFAHGFLIIPIVIYLIWDKRKVLAAAQPRPAPVALVFLLAMSVAWLLGHVAEVAVLKQLAATAMLPGLVWAIFGTAVASRIIFPLAYLFFAVPVGDFLVGPLQDITAAFTIWALQVTGIPVYWEGRFFHIPSGSFEVAEACSGVRYLIASMALGTLYAYLTYTTLQRRLLFVALSAIVPIIANGIRAYGIVMLAHLSDYKLAVGVDHIIYGWLFFGVVIFGLFWAGSLFRERPSATVADDSAAAVKMEGSLSVGVKSFALWAVLATTLAFSGPGFSFWLDTQRAARIPAAPELPAGQNGWTGPLMDNSQWKPHFGGAVEQRGIYRKGDQRVSVYLAYYSDQSQGKELDNWNNRLFDSDTSRRQAETDTRARLHNGQDWAVHSTQIETDGALRLIWHWYEINGHATTNRVMAKAYEVQRRLTGADRGAAAWVISTRYEMMPAEAESTLTEFLDDMLPVLQEAP